MKRGLGVLALLGWAACGSGGGGYYRGGGLDMATGAPGTCNDGIKNQNESDVDCGGKCSGCADGQHCNQASDCKSMKCTGGVCGGGVAPCNNGLVMCSGACVDLTADSANCGACGKACGGVDACMNGVCTTMCQNGTVLCNGVCVDTGSDAGNCGVCGRACAIGQLCQGGVCMASCGGGQMMCNGNCVNTSSDPANCGGCGIACQNGQNCVNSACAGGGANTGDPCTKNADCAGTKAVCIIKDAMGNVWPGGYCTSVCNPLKNDPNDGSNVACPGGMGTCQGNGATGSCGLLCTNMNGAAPCTRQGYACFQICEPKALSQCDPTVKGSCGVNKSCVRIGADNVGTCVPLCDPFKQTCPPDMNNMMQACYASVDTGEGACSVPYGNPPGADGDICMFLNGCSAGLGCYAPPGATMQSQVLCRPYCGGAMNVACKNGKKCVDLSMTVKTATIGVCGG
jgi:hypothetical protein